MEYFLGSKILRKFRQRDLQQQVPIVVGLIGAIISIAIFISDPSFPTPDKLFVPALFIGMIFSQGLQIVYRLGPFALLLIAYESFRGLATELNSRVNYTFMVNFDKSIFGTLPTKTLQKWWWHGHVQWYDYAFYIPYMMHFLTPFLLAVTVWKTRESQYWRLITAYVSVSFFAFLVFLAFPAAPPWMASDYHIIEPITRVSSYVWAKLGIHDFPSVYNQVTPNPVAAVPSLHAAYATIFAIAVIRLYSFRARYLVVIYPMLIYVGTIYQGEHYFFDELVGALLGLAGYWAAPSITRRAAVVVGYLKQFLFALTFREI